MNAHSNITQLKGDLSENATPLDTAYRVSSGELRSFVERIERLEAEKADIAAQIKEVKAEAKSRGYLVRVLSKVIALRKRDKDDIAEEQAVMDLYTEALGM